MFLPVFVCLSVCLLSRLLKNMCMHLDEMLCVDRCLDMDELIKLLSPIRIIVRMPEPDCFLQYRIGYGTLQPCLGCQRAVLLCGFLHRGKITCIRIGGAELEQAVVLKWFYFLSRRKTFVRGKCALPSAFLVTPLHVGWSLACR